MPKKPKTPADLGISSHSTAAAGPPSHSAGVRCYRRGRSTCSPAYHWPVLRRRWNGGRGPSHVVRQGKTPVLEPAEARALLDSIDVTTPAGLRDRALIALMVFSFARIGAALAMKVEDVFVQNRRLWVRLREKGGKAHAMPCHHTIEEYLTAYLEETGIMDDLKGPLFRTIGRGTGQLTRTPLPQANAYAMIARRAAAAGLKTKVGNHSFRATGITAYLKNGGTLEKAAAMANHASTRTTQLYDHRHDEMSLDEVERIRV